MFGALVTIQRAGRSTSNVTASWFMDKEANAVNRSSPRGTRSVTTVTASTRRAWVVAKSAYKFSGATVEPARGDRIIDGDGTQWELLPDGEQEAWQDMGADWHLLTKKAG